MRYLICGGRDFNHKTFFHHVLNEDIGITKDDFIISGGAKGADTLAHEYALDNDLDFEIYPAQWKTYGKRAGYLRNKQMLDEGKPDRVIAFPGGTGTRMMIKLAEEAGVPVFRVRY